MDVVDYRLDAHEKRMEAQDAKIDRIEAAVSELRVTVARMEAQLGAITASLSGLPSSLAGLRGTVILTGVATVTLVVGILAYGQTWFGLGVSSRDVIRATVMEMRQDATTPKP